jgi:hypothetical protein
MASQKERKQYRLIANYIEYVVFNLISFMNFIGEEEETLYG